MTTPSAADPPQLMFDDGSRIMKEAGPVAKTEPRVSARGSRSIAEFYEIERLAMEILQLSAVNNNDNDGWLCRVALQFPDELLQDAPDVVWAMEQALEQSSSNSKPPLVFILGDTTFGSCCPDEVSALHLQADVLVHYGHACLSPAVSLPVLYSFGITDMNVEKCVDQVMKEASKEGNVKQLLLLYDVRYHHAMQELEQKLKERGGLRVVVGQLPQSRGIHDDDGTASTIADVTEPESILVGGLQVSVADIDLTTFTLLFVGDYATTSSRQYVNSMLRFLTYPGGQPAAFWTYSPFEQTLETTLPLSLSRKLNRRFFLTQKARDASVFGILVGTLSQRHFTSVVSSLRKVIQEADRACYTFAIGKINAAKLANFAEIECFVLVACGEHSLLENERDLHVPVITPLELSIALGKEEWGVYSLDYNDFLRNQASSAPETITSDKDDAPYFSLVTGKYVDTKRHGSNDDINLKALPGGGQLMAHQSEAANFLKNREYQGLQTALGETKVRAAKPGQTGIASSYGETITKK